MLKTAVMNIALLTWLMIITLCPIKVSTDTLFSGSGLTIYAYNILRGDTLEMNCTTYDDCYDLLCSYLIQPMYLVTIKPNVWDEPCSTLYKDDNRKL